MSHVTLLEPDTADQAITDIEALSAACTRLGLVFKRGQKHFRTWADDHGRLVGDWPLPTGYKTLKELQDQCEHAIGLPDKSAKGTNAYEIGVIRSRKFPGTYSMTFDFFGGALDNVASQPGCKRKLAKLEMYYQAEAARRKAKAMGYQYKEKVMPDGSLEVTVDMTTKLGY